MRNREEEKEREKEVAYFKVILLFLRKFLIFNIYNLRSENNADVHPCFLARVRLI